MYELHKNIRLKFVIKRKIRRIAKKSKKISKRVLTSEERYSIIGKPTCEKGNSALDH